MNNSSIVRILRISLFLFFVANFQVFASFQQTDTKAYKECDKLNNSGLLEMNNGNYIKALEFYTKAELIAEKNHYDNQLVAIKGNLGTIYKFISNYGDAMKCYLEALKIAGNRSEFRENSLMILNNISVLYTTEEDYEAALEYALKAYIIAKQIKSDKNQVILGINISDAYNKLGDYEKARAYLMEIKAIPKEKLYEQVWDVNYAESYLLQGDVNKAQKIMENVLKTIDDKTRERDKNVCYICVVELLSRIYERQDKTALAILYANKGLKNTSELKDRINLYDHLSHLYQRNKDYNTAFKYKDSLVLAKDSLSELVNRGLFETNKMKLKIRDYESEVKYNKQKQETGRRLFIIIITLALLIFLFIYRVLKNKIIKQKQEKIITENQQKIVSLEMEGLKNNIAEKNRKLSAKASYLSGRNELIEEIISSLSVLPEATLNKELSSYIKTLRSHLKVDAEWDDFIAYFEQVNHDFFRALKTNHTQLTPHDIRFLCYIYMNLDSKEIGTIFNITAEAVKKRKQRIAKKMDMDADDLLEYILKIH